MTGFKRFYAEMYDEIHGDRDFLLDVQNLQQIVSTYLGDSTQLTGLDFGCGTGLHAKYMLDAGKKIMATDTSDAMLEIARARLGLDCIIDRKKSDKPRFDFIYSLFDVVSYQTSEKSLIKFFTEVESLLKPNGMFIFDGWYLSGYLNFPPVPTSKSFSWNNKQFIRKVLPEVVNRDGYARLNISIIEISSGKVFTSEIHELKAYSKPQIEKILKRFQMEISDWKDGGDKVSELNEDSWRFLCIARKKSV